MNPSFHILSKNKSTYFFRYQKYITKTTVLFFALLCSLSSYSQYKFRYNDNDPSTLAFSSGKKSGFSVSASLVAVFTSGVADRNGFRVGAGITLSQTIDNFTMSTGLDAYKANQAFGLGSTFAGITFDNGKYGGSYYVNKYHQADKQVSAIIGLHLDNFHIRFEDDILAMPFTRFVIYDRYRTAALEVRYKHFLIGTNVYTTDTNAVTDVSSDNKMGVYRSAKQLSSPVYIGYTTDNMLIRYGQNSKLGGLLGQNIWHQKLFNSPDFSLGDYNNQFLQIGIDKPYTLY